MAIYDLTHLITEEMPVYPGTPQPAFGPIAQIRRDGYRETLLSVSSHAGTHMDAPAHYLEGGPSLDALPVERFVGKAMVLDCSGLPAGGRIGLESLLAQKEAAEAADFILFYTGRETAWGSPAYFEPYPTPGPELLEWLVERGKKGIGTDALSIDPLEDAALTGHQIALEGGLVILECLTGFGGLSGLFTLCALPLKWRQADGAPVRAIAITDA